jgi:diguanylate cyclase (GGDEF)-like protein
VTSKNKTAPGEAGGRSPVTSANAPPPGGRGALLPISLLVFLLAAAGVLMPALLWLGLREAGSATPWPVLLASQAVLVAGLLVWVLQRRLLTPLGRLARQAGTVLSGEARASRRHGDPLVQLGRHLERAHACIEGLTTELEGRHAELRRLAMVDQLTGLPNRGLFRELFDHALARARRSQQPMALMFIDLDRFKHVNDTLGHPAGDELLRCLGQRLRRVMRGSDFVGRLSGDEFVALLPDVPEGDAIAQAALRVIHAIEAPVPVPVPVPGEQATMQVSASVGVACYPQDGEGFDELLRHADQAMYRAKAAGRGRYVLHRDAGRQASPTHGSAAELTLALSRNEMQLYYQPVIDTGTGQAVGVEALLRWNHPSLGLLPPARFIRRAEECGQIQALGQLALGAACRQLARWKVFGLGIPSIAVNLSTAEFRHEHLPSTLARLLPEHGLGPGELELEVSSHTVMSDPEFSQARVEELRALGVGLVLEDVGSSMLSLARLGQLHPAKVKIDAALVSRLPADADADATVRAIVHLGRHLGVRVVASGVETEAQRDALAHAGCRWQQGYLLGRPLPASDAPAWAARQAALASAPAAGAVQRVVPWPPTSANSRSIPH